MKQTREAKLQEESEKLVRTYQARFAKKNLVMDGGFE